MEAKHLLGRGFFPEELIPAFTSEGLLEHYDDIKMRCTTYNYKKTAKSIQFSIPRLHSSRRRLVIPNPFFQYKLCNEIEEHWPEIVKIIDKHDTSLSKPVISTNPTERSLIKKNSYSEIATKKILNSFSARYMVYADISRFHGTVYTHSIPWAIHTKDIAKMDKTDSLFGNKIDKFIRNSQDAQTLGIPTGPDTSYLIAELITSRVDDSLKENLPSTITRFRYIDDFYFFCRTLSEAEIVLTQLTKSLNDFELELNPDKTKIVEMPVEFEPDWVSELREFKFSGFSKKQKIDIINYFNKAFAYSKKYPNDFVIKYAITRIKNKKFSKENWIIYENLLLQSVLSEPSVIKVVLEILLKYSNIDYSIRKNVVKATLYAIFDANIIHGNTYEILWSLWVAKSLKIKVNADYANMLILMDDPLIALVINDMISQNLISSKIDRSIWKQHESFEGLFSEHWIYAYEAYVRNDVITDEKYLNKSDFYKALETNNIRFYDPNKQIEITEFEPFEDEINNKIIQTINDIKNKLAKIEKFDNEFELLQSITENVKELNKANDIIFGGKGYF